MFRDIKSPQAFLPSLHQTVNTSTLILIIFFHGSGRAACFSGAQNVFIFRSLNLGGFLKQVQVQMNCLKVCNRFEFK